MPAQTYQVPSYGDGEHWTAKCYSHDLGYIWVGPEYPHTEAGLAKAFADRDRHNRVEHPDA